MQARDRPHKQQKSSKVFRLSVFLCFYKMLSDLPYLNQFKRLYLATICSGDDNSIIVVDKEDQPVKSKTWSLDSFAQAFVAEPSFKVAKLILNEHKAAYNALKADLGKLQELQHNFQTGPPEIV